MAYKTDGWGIIPKLLTKKEKEAIKIFNEVKKRHMKLLAEEARKDLIEKYGYTEEGVDKI